MGGVYSQFPQSPCPPFPWNSDGGLLTVDSDLYFPHIGGSNVIQGAALILPRLVTFDVGDFQVFVLTHKALAVWEERNRDNQETVKPGA